MKWSDAVPDALPGETAEAYLERMAAKYPNGVRPVEPAESPTDKSST